MADIRKLAGNVSAFLSRTAEIMGRIEAERWSQDAFCDLVEGSQQSPIEDLFYIAIKAMCGAQFTAFNPEQRYRSDGSLYEPRGIYVMPQHKVGQYRADFVVKQFGIGPDDVLTPIIVELDGHAFHDRDKVQRSYEKKRDRDLLRAGYRVVHFTGSDVVADPFRVAHEVLEMLGLFDCMGNETYNPEDPMGFM